MQPANGLQVEREGVEMSIKVIGTGFGRTGTDSMREALAILGFGPCHHMHEVIGNEEQKRMWRALAQGAAPDWNQLLSGYVSCLDWPSAYYWRELIEFYPDARVILTYRSAESWWGEF
ncbi:sulfotransferase family protein [Mesorhizobium sp. ES1-3]|uniref:sulfotransferase family protein n=1 Tax=Mesorhizobium sp. ES1-3 TaxID=2876628 RepID=UPI0021E29953|nr:sulfotransferase family protein [Mesorhizobium sp. ES1-3]